MLMHDRLFFQCFWNFPPPFSSFMLENPRCLYLGFLPSKKEAYPMSRAPHNRHINGKQTQAPVHQQASRRRGKVAFLCLFSYLPVVPSAGLPPVAFPQLPMNRSLPPVPLPLSGLLLQAIKKLIQNQIRQSKHRNRFLPLPPPVSRCLPKKTQRILTSGCSR